MIDWELRRNVLLDMWGAVELAALRGCQDDSGPIGALTLSA